MLIMLMILTKNKVLKWSVWVGKEIQLEMWPPIDTCQPSSILLNKCKWIRWRMPINILLPLVLAVTLALCTQTTILSARLSIWLMFLRKNRTTMLTLIVQINPYYIWLVNRAIKDLHRLQVWKTYSVKVKLASLLQGNYLISNRPILINLKLTLHLYTISWRPALYKTRQGSSQVALNKECSLSTRSDRKEVAVYLPFPTTLFHSLRRELWTATLSFLALSKKLTPSKSINHPKFP